ncbi:MAG: hypothetical protein U0325_09265 [Polyangiales bacterium]
MQPHLAPSDDPFAAALAHFSTTCDWLRADAMDLAHGEIETHVYWPPARSRVAWSRGTSTCAPARSGWPSA